MSELNSLLWKAESLPAGIALALKHSGLADGQIEQAFVKDAPENWLNQVLALLQCEAEPLPLKYTSFEASLHQSSPLLLQIHEEAYLLILKSKGKKAVILSPEQQQITLPVAELKRLLTLRQRETIETEMSPLWEAIQIAPARRERLIDSLIEEALGHRPIARVWHLRLRPNAPFWKQARRMKLPQMATGLLGLHFLEQGANIAAWAVLGWMILRQELSIGYFIAWALALLTAQLLRLHKYNVQQFFQADANLLLHSRLYYGISQFHHDSLRSEGTGRFLGRVLEAQNMDVLLQVSGGVRGILGVSDLILAFFILLGGAGGWPHALLLLLWASAVTAASVYLFRTTDQATAYRRDITHNLVERLIGARTRLVQQDPRQWHDEEDEELAAYLRLSKKRDRADVFVHGVFVSWIAIGLIGLLPAYLAGASLELMLISIGGVVLSSSAAPDLNQGVTSLIQALVAWKQVKDIYHASKETEVIGTLTPSKDNDLLLAIEDLHFRYDEKRSPVLQGINLSIAEGERILLEGASGGGKSTLASIIAALRDEHEGKLLYKNHDFARLGANNWRKQIVLAPQFHENYIFTAPLAFNVLMGRGGELSPEHVAEAEAICRELGLGDLIDRMPGGMFQTVGETGWKLSHGERSRIFIARALFQNADLLILDESLASLDPENIHLVISCLLKRAKTLLIIAHP